MKHLLQNFSIGVLILSLTSAIAWAQLSTAELSGRVTDESGAVLPGASVTVTQTDTTVTRSVVSDATGSYVLSNLPTGPYRLEVSLSGFGRILSLAGAPGSPNQAGPMATPRIMQFSIKYDF